MAKTVVLVCVLLVACCVAHATMIDLRTFSADGEVTFYSDGTVATFAESKDHMETFLSDDPGMDDPEVIFAGPGVLLQFDYLFTDLSHNGDDGFSAWIIGPDGGSIGAAYEFSLSYSGDGVVSFDLTDLTDLVGAEPLGVQFQLSSLNGTSPDYDSTLQISNVQLVPEPVTVVALGSLLAGIFTARRLKRD
jgi:hypothetical protein